MQIFLDHGVEIHPKIGKKYEHGTYTERIAIGVFHERGIAVDMPRLKIYGKAMEHGLDNPFVAKLVRPGGENRYGQLVGYELQEFLNHLLDEYDFVLTRSDDNILFNEPHRVDEILFHDEQKEH